MRLLRRYKITSGTAALVWFCVLGKVQAARESQGPDIFPEVIDRLIEQEVPNSLMEGSVLDKTGNKQLDMQMASKQSPHLLLFHRRWSHIQESLDELHHLGTEPIWIGP